MDGGARADPERLLEHLPGMAYRAEAEPTRPLRSASAGGEALTRRSRAALVGVTLGELTHPDDVDRVARRVADAIDAAQPYDLEYRIRTPEGDVVVVRDRGAPVQGPDGQVMEVVGFLCSATTLAREQEWTRRTHQAIVALALDRTLSDGDVDAFARRVARTAVEHLDVSRAGVWLLNERQSEMRLVSMYLGESGSHVEGAVLHASDFPAYFAALSGDRAIAAENAATDPRTAEFADNYLREYDIRSMLDSTIRLGGKVVGVLCNEQVGRLRRWELPEISFAGELADQVAQAIANQRRRRAERDALLAEHRSAAKSRFLATMSHEIRTPMNGVLGMARMLEETELTVEQAELVQTIRESGDLLLGVINDVLDFARIEADKLTITPTSVDIRGLVRRSLRILKAAAQEKALDLDGIVDDEVPERCLADEGRLEQILVNLLGNAIKFTETGSVHLRVDDDPDASPPTLRFQVADTGIGIDPQRISSLFEAFEQDDEGRKAGRGGTGLGLAISRRLAELMGGTLSAESTPGRGSVFELTIPLREADEAVPVTKETSPDSEHGDDLSNLRVLVAEDNAVNQRVIAAMLRHHGIHPVLCGNGQEVLDVLAQESQPFDLIFMDCEMPVLSGTDATRRLRASEGVHGTTAVVALTAHALPEFQDLARAAGMNEYLTKPLRLEAVTEVLRRAADRHRR